MRSHSSSIAWIICPADTESIEDANCRRFALLARRGRSGLGVHEPEHLPLRLRGQFLDLRGDLKATPPSRSGL